MVQTVMQFFDRIVRSLPVGDNFRNDYAVVYIYGSLQCGVILGCDSQPKSMRRCCWGNLANWSTTQRCLKIIKDPRVKSLTTPSDMHTAQAVSESHGTRSVLNQLYGQNRTATTSSMRLEWVASNAAFKWPSDTRVTRATLVPDSNSQMCSAQNRHIWGEWAPG